MLRSARPTLWAQRGARAGAGEARAARFGRVRGRSAGTSARAAGAEADEEPVGSGRERGDCEAERCCAGERRGRSPEGRGLNEPDGCRGG